MSIISQLSGKFLSIHCKGIGYYVITCSIVCSCSYLVKTSRCHPNQRVNSQPQILVHFHLQQVHVCDFSLQTFMKESVCYFFFHNNMSLYFVFLNSACIYLYSKVLCGYPSKCVYSVEKGQHWQLSGRGPVPPP